MAVDRAFIECLLVSLAGFTISALAEFLAIPEPSFKRPWQSWLIHFSLWNFTYGAIVLITGRPICAASFGLAFIFILIFVNNAKYRSMREPFLYQDYNYFLDTLRFPRLFLPFLGLRSFCLCAFGVIVAIGAIWLEPAPAGRWQWNSQAGSCIFLLVLALAAFLLAKKFAPPLTLSPLSDMRNLGFLSCMAFYGIAWNKQKFPQASLPVWKPVSIEKYPHLVAIQSESFFDCRECWPELRESVYNAYDLFAGESFQRGDLLVPAYGANTERSEFSFLTGISPSALGTGRFNPYQLLLRGWRIPALPAHFRSAGYRTICIHPYIRAFYGRDKIFPELGFDEFIDLSYFSSTDHFGPYVGDMAIADKILEIQRKMTGPTFIFAITMENHGPLHLEKAPDSESAKTLFKKMPPENCEELGIYLRHVRNTGRMLEKLREEWTKWNKAVSLCFYGDHVPIMPSTWNCLRFPKGHVPYFCWSNKTRKNSKPELLAVSQLAAAWLEDLWKEC